MSRGPFGSPLIFLLMLQAIAIGIGDKTPFFSYFASAHVRQHPDILSTMTIETY